VAIDSHARRVSMIKAVGGEQVPLDGRIIYGIFDDDDVLITDFAGRSLDARSIRVQLSYDDVQDAARGSVLVRGSSRFTVDRVERFDAGMARLHLMTQQDG
jgi:hypothetical protein